MKQALSEGKLQIVVHPFCPETGARASHSLIPAISLLKIS